MNVSKTLLALALASGVVQIAVAADAAAPADVPLSRAEVIADFQVWRESGMEAISNGDEPAIFHPAYAQVHARYLAMRESPAFAQLVRRIAERRGERLTIAAAR